MSALVGASSDSTDLVGMLRLRTREQHEALDRGMKIGRSAPTLDDYVAFLRASLEAIAPLEDALAELEGCAVEKRADRIRADLDALGAPVKRVTPASGWIPRVIAEGRGCAYVIEGSTLGGIMLAKHVARHLGLDDQQTSYLRFRGSETKARWTAFIGTLNAWGAAASAADRDRACEAAAKTFSTYADVFQRVGAKDVSLS